MNYEDLNCPQGKIMHQHYTKPMASRVGVQKNSAISEREKRTINTQELIRVMRNCHKDMPEEEKNEILSDSMKRLQNSGYNEEYRLEILKSAINGFEKQVQADKNGVTPLYRPREYKKVER